MSIAWVSDTIKGLLPHNCGVGWHLVSSTCQPLSIDEENAIRTALPQRKAEFRAGRSAAKQALGNLGCYGVSISMKQDRTPDWPRGFAGSISHANGIAIAAASKTTARSSLGVDLEAIGSLQVELWPEIFTQEEIQFLSALPPTEWPAHATILFSLKESFYKYQYTYTRQWLDFKEATIFLNIEAKSAVLTTMVPIPIEGKIRSVFIGNYSVGESFVMSAFC